MEEVTTSFYNITKRLITKRNQVSKYIFLNKFIKHEVKHYC